MGRHRLHAARVFFDSKNALPSTDRAALQEHADITTDEIDLQMTRWRREHSHFQLDTVQGSRIVIPKTGSLMGDSCAPSDFVATYQPGVEQWLHRLQEWYPMRRLGARVVLGGQLYFHQCSTTVFVGDIGQTSPPLAPSELVSYVSETPKLLTEALAERGHAINPDKQVVQVLTPSKNIRTAFATSLAKGLGQVQHQARYLGPVMSCRSEHKGEIRRRKEAEQVSFARLGRFWTSTAAPSHERRTFYASIYSVLLSASAVFRLIDREMHKLDELLVGKMRIMPRGRATWQAEGDHLRTLTNEQVRAWWCLPTVQAELLSQRIGWHKTILAHPQRHEQLVVAIFGKFPWEGHLIVDENGHLHEKASKVRQEVGGGLAAALDL